MSRPPVSEADTSVRAQGEGLTPAARGVRPIVRLWERFRGLPVWVQVLAWITAWPVPTALYAAAQPQATRRRWWAVTAAAALVWVGAAGASSQRPERTEQAGRSTGSATTTVPAAAPTPESSTATTETNAQPVITTTTAAPTSETSSLPAATGPRPTTMGKPGAATTSTTAQIPLGDPSAVLAGLRVGSEAPRTGYDRDLFVHWVDADGDACDTREEVLIAESRTQVQLDPYGCKVLAGDWYSAYDGRSFTDPSGLDVDHMVPLAEAWDSGAATWDAGRRRAFANDLGHPGALRAVSASSNRSKGDLDPGQWKPTRDAAWCEYANDWVTVKKAWDLTADQNEIDDLRVMLRTCTGVTVTTTPPTTLSPTTTTTPLPVSGDAVTVTMVDCQGEAVTVGNGTAGPADLTGWSIHDEGSNFTYRFPAAHTLAPSASVTIRTGGAAGTTELHWTNSNVWNNTGDRAYLVNAGGEVVSTRSC
jgi:hypothetical protein